MSLAKVTFIKSVKVRCYGLQLCGSMLYQAIGGVCAVCCVLCRVELCTAHSTHTIHMLPHNRMVRNTVLLPI